MKTQARKLLAVLCVVAMIMSMIVPMSITASAASVSETITFDANKTQRTSYSTTKQVWKSDNVTFTNDKASSSTNVADYGNPVRLYAKSTVTITASGTITQIEIVSNGSSSYKTALQNSLTGAGLTYTNNGNTYTVANLNAESVTFTLTAQARFMSLTVTYEEAEAGDPECQHTNTTVLEAKAPTCTEDGLTEGLVCADCGFTITERTTVKATGHSLTVDESASQAPTCTENGTEVSICDVCGETVTEVLEATGHTVVDNTCTSCGATVTPSTEETATLTFDNLSKRTEFDTSHQVWVENGITLTNNKSSSTNNVASYSSPVRFYAKSELVITAPSNITKIVFTCNTTAYATTLGNSISGSTVNGKLVTVELSGEAATYTVASLSGQVRMDSIEVTYVGGNPDCPHTNTTVVEGKAATCTENGLTDGSKCSNCGEILTVQTVIPATGHDLVLDESKSTAATCTENGTKVSTCKNCGETVSEEVSATGHTLVNNKCTSCEYTVDPTIEATENLSFATDEQRASFSNEQQVWISNGITFTNDKAGYNNSLGNYVAPIRLYANTTVTISAPAGITKIVFNCNTAAYANVLADSIGSVTANEKTVTVELPGNATEYTITISGSQVRLDSIDVTYGGIATITGVSLNVGSDLSLLTYVALPEGQDIADFAMKFVHENGTEIIVTAYTEKDGKYVFTLDKIAPQAMSDLITVSLLNGETVLQTKANYSVKAYAQAILSGDHDIKLKTFVSDMLVYGAAAQNFVGYNTDNLATADVTGLVASTSTPTDADNVNAGVQNGEAVEGLGFTSVGVKFDSANYIYAKFKANSLDGITVTINGTVAEIKDLGKGVYAVYSEAIYATDFGTTYTIVLNNGTDYQTLTYSVNSYAFAKANTELGLALYRYGASANELNP